MLGCHSVLKKECCCDSAKTIHSKGTNLIEGETSVANGKKKGDAECLCPLRGVGRVRRA